MKNSIRIAREPQRLPLKKAVTYYANIEDFDRLKAAADTLGMSISSAMRLAVAEWLNTYEPKARKLESGKRMLSEIVN
jgi:hypothetical protein